MIDTGFHQLAEKSVEQSRLRFEAAHRSHPSDAISGYLRDIGRYSRLTPDQERCLSRRIRNCRVKFRHAMLSDENVLMRVAKLLDQVGSGHQRADRVLDVTVNQMDEKRRLKQIAMVNGNTLLGMLANDGVLKNTARIGRAICLVDETKLKTCEIEYIWRSISICDSAPQRHLSAYERLRNEMITANLRLVVSVARKFQGRGLPFLDLVQEASAGLFRAIDRFDPERGLKFSTYAVWWARQSVQFALVNKGHIIRLNPTAMQRIRELKEHAAELQQNCERKIGLDEVAESLGEPREALLHYWRAQAGVSSLDEAIDVGSDETFADSLVDTEHVNHLRSLIRAGQGSGIRYALRILEPRERKVIDLRFGLKDGVYRNLAEVGRKLSLTRERIRQIEKASLEKLRQELAGSSKSEEGRSAPRRHAVREEV